MDQQAEYKKNKLLDMLRISKYLWDRVEKLDLIRDNRGRVMYYKLYLADGCTYQGERYFELSKIIDIDAVLNNSVLDDSFVHKPMKRTSNRVTLETRMKIEAACRMDHTVSGVARIAEVKRSTLQTEFNRTGMDIWNYKAEEAQRICDSKKSKK